MPIYEYECEKCSYRFELKKSFSEASGSPCCPRCQFKIRRIFSPSAILFKGSGFYVTDSRSDPNRPSEEGKADKVEGEIKEEGKADKVDGGVKDEATTDKVESGIKEESKAGNDQSGNKSESK